MYGIIKNIIGLFINNKKEITTNKLVKYKKGKINFNSLLTKCKL